MLHRPNLASAGFRYLQMAFSRMDFADSGESFYTNVYLLAKELSIAKLRKPYETKGFSSLSFSGCPQNLSDRLQGLRRALGNPAKPEKYPKYQKGFCENAVLKQADFFASF